MSAGWLKRMQKSWPRAIAKIVTQLILQPVDKDALYQPRELNAKPMRIWEMKLRLSVLCASGREALFVRPTLLAMVQASDAYTIIWSKRHEMGSATLLAELLKRAEKVT